MTDPRDENCRGYRLENGLVTGVLLDYLPLPTSRFELKRVTLIPQGASGDTTTATVYVLDKAGLPAEVPVVLAWPWVGNVSMPYQLLPGNANRPAQHMITNSYDAAAGLKGPLAIYLAADNRTLGTAISDVCGALGLPNSRHVDYVLLFQERGAVDPGGSGDFKEATGYLREIRDLLRAGFRPITS